MHIKTLCYRSQLSVKVVQCVQFTPECVHITYKAKILLRGKPFTIAGIKGMI